MSNAPVLQGHARHSNSHTLLSQQKTATRVGNNLTLIYTRQTITKRTNGTSQPVMTLRCSFCGYLQMLLILSQMSHKQRSHWKWLLVCTCSAGTPGVKPGSHSAESPSETVLAVSWLLWHFWICLRLHTALNVSAVSLALSCPLGSPILIL